MENNDIFVPLITLESGETPLIVEKASHKCPNCYQTFKTIANVKSHFHKRHPEFRLPLYLIHHVYPKKKIYCEYCRKGFTLRSALKDHLLKHTKVKNFKCGVCKKSFSRMMTLKMHNRVHTGEKPHVCDICRKTFCQLSHLNSHFRVHTGEKPFACDFCDAKFSDSSSLNKHCQKVHKK